MSDTVTVRPATEDDVSGICSVCDLAWKGIWQGNHEIFRDRIRAFPEHGLLVAEVAGRIEAYVSVQITDEQTILIPNWNAATDSGRITRTHDVHAEWIHGIGLAATPEASKRGLIGRLIEHLNKYMVKCNKRGARFVTRIPGYHRFVSEVAVHSYVQATHRGKPVDPELRVFQHYDFVVPSPPIIFSSYVGGGDPRSCGLSVMGERLNPFFVHR